MLEISLVVLCIAIPCTSFVDGLLDHIAHARWQDVKFKNLLDALRFGLTRLVFDPVQDVALLQSFVEMSVLVDGLIARGKELEKSKIFSALAFKDAQAFESGFDWRRLEAEFHPDTKTFALSTQKLHETLLGSILRAQPLLPSVMKVLVEDDRDTRVLTQVYQDLLPPQQAHAFSMKAGRDRPTLQTRVSTLEEYILLSCLLIAITLSFLSYALSILHESGAAVIAEIAVCTILTVATKALVIDVITVILLDIGLPRAIKQDIMLAKQVITTTIFTPPSCPMVGEDDPHSVVGLLFASAR
jgi:hypothetical protein